MTRKIAGTLAGTAALAALAGALTLYGVNASRGSDHLDSPTTQGRPGADITDTYAFPAPDNDNNVVFVMNLHPLIPAGQGPTTSFDPGVMLQLKIDNTGDHVEDQVIQFRAEGTGADQKIHIYGPGKPSMTGTQSAWLDNEIGSVGYDTTTQFYNGMKAYAGPRKDTFFFDLAQFFKIIPDRAGHAPGAKTPAATAGSFNNPGVDFLSTNKFNVLSLVVELPRSMLAAAGDAPGKINFWGTASVKSGGSWQQIERLGRPAVKEVFEAYDSHDQTNRATPANDPLLPNDIYTFSTTVAGRSPAIANVLKAVLIPDEIAVDLSQKSVPAAYLGVETGGATGSKFGGRGLRDDIVDISLGAIFGNTIPALKLAADDGKEVPGLESDHVDPQQTYGKKFPYLNAPY